MTTMASGVDYAELAKAAVGNWRKFHSFGWHDQPDDADQWCIVYTNNRDSGLMAESNAAAIDAALAPHLEADSPDIMPEHHGHWACGWVDGYAIRVYATGAQEPTEAFKAWCDLQAALEDYPVLDDEDYSRREYEATIENISGELNRANGEDEYHLPDEGAAEAVWQWLWDNNQGAIENRDDQGGYATTEEIQEAFEGLGWRITYVVRYIDLGEQREHFRTEWEAEERCAELRQNNTVAFYDAVLPEHD